MRRRRMPAPPWLLVVCVAGVLSALFLVPAAARWRAGPGHKVPVLAPDAGKQPHGDAGGALAVARAYANAMEAQDAAGVAAVLSGDITLGNYFCCPVNPRKEDYVRTLPGWWAGGTRSRFADFAVAGDTVTLRARNAHELEWKAGVPPVEIIYTLMIRDGLIVAASGTLDTSAEQTRLTYLAALHPRPGPAPAPAPEPRPPDTQGRTAPAPAAWLAAASFMALAAAATMVARNR